MASSWMTTDPIASPSEMLPQAMKGLLAALGAGSGITRTVLPIRTSSLGTWADIWDSPLVSAVQRAPTGCVVTVASKLVATVQGRRVTDGQLSAAVGGGQPVGDILQILRKIAQVPVDERDVLMIDADDEPDTWILGPSDPNGFAAQLSAGLHERTGTWCDVVITDSGAGAAKGTRLIGAPTYICTPVGATAGLSLVHAQRTAVVGEYFGNSEQGLPFTLISPQGARSANRPGVGSLRYHGFLDSAAESSSLPVWSLPPT